MREGEKALPQPEQKQKLEVVKGNKSESIEEVTKIIKELQI